MDPDTNPVYWTRRLRGIREVQFLSKNYFWHGNQRNVARCKEAGQCARAKHMVTSRYPWRELGKPRAWHVLNCCRVDMAVVNLSCILGAVAGHCSDVTRCRGRYSGTFPLRIFISVGARSQNGEKLSISLAVSAWMNLAPFERIFVKFHVPLFFEKLPERIQFSLESEKNNGYFIRRPMHIYDNTLLYSL